MSPPESTATTTPTTGTVPTGGPEGCTGGGVPPRIRAAAPVTTTTTIRASANRFRVRRSTGQALAVSAPAPVPVLPGACRGTPAAHIGQVGLARFVGRQVQRPERAQRVGPAGRRRRERRAPAAPVDQHGALDDLAAHRLDRGEHREQRAAGGQDVVDEQHALARLDAEAAAELAPGRPVVGADLLGEDAAHAELARGLEGEDDAAGGRAGDQVDHRLRRRDRGRAPRRTRTGRSWPPGRTGPRTSRRTRRRGGRS